MSQASKMVLVAIVAALIGGGGVYLMQRGESQESPSISIQEQELNDAETITVTEVTSSNEWNELIGYNCELSGGSFSGNACECPLEKGQTQEDMYDESTGYCQSSMGGPSGDAFAASAGLPWGKYSYWADIVGNNCTETDGNWLNARCTCSDGKSYDKSTGYCK